MSIAHKPHRVGVPKSEFGIPLHSVHGTSGIIGYLKVMVKNPEMKAIGEVVTPTSEIATMTSVDAIVSPTSETSTMTTDFTTSVT